MAVKKRNRVIKTKKKSASDQKTFDFDSPESSKPKAPKASTPPAGASAPKVEGKKPVRKRTAAGERKHLTAEQMATRQRDISVSEFFAKNRHLLGFDNPRKALLTTIKEAVDNSLDACEEAGILPELAIVIKQVVDDRFLVSVTDNGPGIVKAQIPNIFAKLLYGSKFHQLKMSRGQQGIGISAAGMYGLLTTGKSIKIISRTSRGRPAHYYELQIDTRKNRPEIIRDEEVDWDSDHGTEVEICLEARYQKGRQSVDEYLEQTAIANPHAHVRYQAPEGRFVEFKRVSDELPRIPRSIKPHPHGVELGVLIKMMKDSDKKTLGQFLTSQFSRVSPAVAGKICDNAKIRIRARPTRMARAEADKIHRAIGQVKIKAPSTDCVAAIGAEALEAGLRKEVRAEFYAACSRSPAVYRGNPFLVEAALAYGSGVKVPRNFVDEDGEPIMDLADDHGEKAQVMRVLRFANRVPLLYQRSACAITRSIIETNWRNYGLSQSRGGLPTGPVHLLVHVASVWVPFTSESKEAIAHYPEILKEIRLAVQEVGRKLGSHVRRRAKIKAELLKRSYIEKYLPHIGIALQEILDLKDRQVDKVTTQLKGVLERSRKM